MGIENLHLLLGDDMSENDGQHQLTEQQRIQKAENEANGVDAPIPSSSQATPTENNPTPDNDVSTQPEDDNPEANVGSPVNGE